jgi:hypothetical protein
MKQRTFWISFLIATAWINLSEVFRYLAIVMPAMRQDLSGVPNVAPMNLAVFSIWGLWDTILTCMLILIVWLCKDRFSNKNKMILVAGTIMWTSFFLLFWLGMVNMNLAKPALAMKALPLAWLEMVFGAWLVNWSLVRFDKT